MAYNMGNGIWRYVFAVPSEVVDAHIKIASGLSVKVLLLLLRHGGELQLAEIAEMTGQSVADVQDAVNYWVRCGLVAAASASGESEEPAPFEDRAAQSDPQTHSPKQEVPASSLVKARQEVVLDSASESERKITTLAAGRRRLSTGEINEMAGEDENIAYLLQEAQLVLGKTLTPISTETIIALYSYHGMQPDLILMLLHYCISTGKESMRYVEKMAADWLDRGIDSHEKAETEILRLSQKQSLESKVKTAFGIYDRTLISAEKKFIQKWIEEYGQDLQLISLAYERSVEIKGSLSFPYINGILTNWHNSGITTPAQALKEMQEKRENKSNPKQPSGEASYDMGELEKMIAYGDI